MNDVPRRQGEVKGSSEVSKGNGRTGTSDDSNLMDQIFISNTCRLETRGVVIGFFLDRFVDTQPCYFSSQENCFTFVDQVRS